MKDARGETMTAAEIAWAAGFFDGSGCILGKRRPRDRARLVVTVTQVDRRPLDWLRDHFGGGISQTGSAMRWEVDYAKARAFLTAVLPYLRVRRERAELALSCTPDELAMIRNRPAA